MFDTFSTATNEQIVRRVRYPRHVAHDGLVRPYIPHEAMGVYILNVKTIGLLFTINNSLSILAIKTQTHGLLCCSFYMQQQSTNLAVGNFQVGSNWRRNTLLHPFFSSGNFSILRKFHFLILTIFTGQLITPIYARRPSFYEENK